MRMNEIVPEAVRFSRPFDGCDKTREQLLILDADRADPEGELQDLVQRAIANQNCPDGSVAHEHHQGLSREQFQLAAVVRDETQSLEVPI